MPTYDYVCKECGYRFETFQSISQNPLTDCPSCHQQTLRRLIGAGAGLVFKGSGFYLTDYKNKSTSTAKSNASSASGSDTKSESVTKNETISSNSGDQ